MSTGTKAFLSIFALAIALLVLYYGLLVPQTGTLNPENTDAPPSVLDPTQAEQVDNGRASTPATVQQDSSSVRGSAVNDMTATALTDLQRHHGVAGVPPPVGESLEQSSPAAVTPVHELVQLALAQRDPDVDGTLLDVSPVNPNSAGSSATPGRTAAQPPTTSGSAPASSRSTQPVATPGSMTEYKVQAGDTFISIADAWFGDGKKWDLIAKANPLVDPTKLNIGQPLRLPPKDAKRPVPSVNTNPAAAPASAAAKPGKTYTVQSEDTLSSIAEALLGDSSQWKALFEANREVLKDDPNRLTIGMTLRVPE